MVDLVEDTAPPLCIDRAGPVAHVVDKAVDLHLSLIDVSHCS